MIQLEGLQGLDGLLEDMADDSSADPAPEAAPAENANVETADEDQTAATPAADTNTETAADTSAATTETQAAAAPAEDAAATTTT